MCTWKLVRKFVIFLNSWQLRECLAWQNWFFRNTFPRDDARSGSPKRCHCHLPTDRNNSRQFPWAADRASRMYLSEQTGHPEVSFELHKTCHMWGSESRGAFTHPHSLLLDCTGELKRTLPPPPCSWFLGAPRTLELLASPACPQNEEWVWVSQLWHMTCLLETFYISWHHDLSKIVLCASARSAHMLWVCFCSLILQWVSGLRAPWHAKAWVCPLRNAWNIHVCLTVPNISVSFAIFPPHQFQTNSLLDTKEKEEVSLKADLEPQDMWPSMLRISWCLTDSQNLQLGVVPQCVLLAFVPRPIIFPPSTISM